MKAIIEIPRGSYYKYEIDKATGQLTLDRVLTTAYPYNYGFIPNTLQPDNDPLDIFVISEDPIVPLASVNVEVVGAFKCLDNGVVDDKIISYLNKSAYSTYEAIHEIEHFLRNYKTGFQVLDKLTKEEAEELIKESSI